MKKGKSTELKDKYWNGISSLKEERGLKEKQDAVYFDGLKNAKKETMDWSFDDFLADVEKQDVPKPVVMSRHSSFRIWSYGAAAVVFLLVGLLYIYNQEEGQEISGSVGDTDFIAQGSVMLDVPALRKKEQATIDVGEPSQERKYANQLLTRNTPLLSTEATDEIREVAVEETYVFVNGQPVYGEDEVEEIALASLKLMVNNFREGKEALEKMKYIKIEL